ncbi:30S ribosomal protein S4 [Candidatus Woesearchaeota archaeon]|nr:30S ribosomal protein S4 [Candidatus Woesearchaeota archaeon]
MGDPKKNRKKHDRPLHPWRKERIDAEKSLVKQYGLKNKREVWQMAAVLRSIRDQAKNLIAARGVQAERERGLLLSRLARLGLVSASAKLDDVLGLTLNNILDRRLQTVVVRKGLAKTMNQSRQFIVHTHIVVKDKTITRPSYLVPNTEEPLIVFSQASKLASVDHPVRAPPAGKSSAKVEVVKEEPKVKSA